VNHPVKQSVALCGCISVLPGMVTSVTMRAGHVALLILLLDSKRRRQCEDCPSIQEDAADMVTKVTTPG
jgi:hypothetical protein